MKRYRCVHKKEVPMIRLEFANIKNECDRFLFDISPGDNVSILYLDDHYEIGKQGEYVVNGKIIRFIYTRDKNKTKYLHSLLVDAGIDYKAKTLELKLRNILDIHTYPYEYDLNENIKVVPDIRERFFVKEIVHPQTVDMTVINDATHGDCDYKETAKEEDSDE